VVAMLSAGAGEAAEQWEHNNRAKMGKRL